MIKIIAAVSENMVIGKDNKIPWHYPEDLKHFKEMTLDSVVIMGKKTFESIGKPLPRRKNIVITSNPINEIECYSSLEDALNFYQFNQIWLIGGRSIYEQGMEYANEIHLTRIPIYIEGDDVIKFPNINESFSKKETIKIRDNLYKDIYIK
jgi:dihydrofolate reductase